MNVMTKKNLRRMGWVFVSSYFSLSLTPALASAKKIVAGSNHNCVLSDSGKVYCWGQNTFGQLGQGDSAMRGHTPESLLQFKAVELGGAAADIAAGANHSCALLTDGTLKCWGSNQYGQLGIGTRISVGTGSSQMGAYLQSIDLGADPGDAIAGMTAGAAHTCAWFQSGKIKCWGNNTNGQTGVGNPNTTGDQPGEMGMNAPWVNLGEGFEVAQAIAGDFHSCALGRNQKLKCWGGNARGQLGYNDRAHRGTRAEHMGDSLSQVVLGLDREIRLVAPGKSHTCAVSSEDEVFCWGDNTLGQLATGTASPVLQINQSNVQSSNLNRMAINPSIIEGLSCQRLSGCCALYTTGSLQCWGQNSQGQIGIESTSPVIGDQAREIGRGLPLINLGRNFFVKDFALGETHVCALSENGAVKCWGYNVSGQLGIGDRIPRGAALNTMGDALPEVKIIFE